MKKNKMMRIASVLLIAAMLSTCVISGTFAKYVTSGTGTDSARVAKWGVEVIANGSAFGYFYKSAEGTISSEYEAATDSVASSNGEKLVAPGTGDEVVAMSITGRPEVDVSVQYTATVTLTGWTYDDDNDPSTSEVEYCPIYFTVDGKTYGIAGNTAVDLDLGYTTVAELQNAVANAIAAYSDEYEANTYLTSVATPDVSWNWDYYSSADNDVKDTALGDKAADDAAATIEIVITTTVTQID